MLAVADQRIGQRAMGWTRRLVGSAGVRRWAPSHAPLLARLATLDGMRRLYCLYARADQPFNEVLRRHLATSRQQGVLTDVDVSDVLAGADVQTATASMLQAADIVVALLSADFFAEERCLAQVEQALAAGQVVVPVQVRAVDVAGTPLESLQMLPRSGLPVQEWATPDQAWVEVTRALRGVASGTAGSQAQPAATPAKLWHIPAPGPYFTGRDEEITAIRKALLATGRSAVGQVQGVSGLGGIGKTQLALG